MFNLILKTIATYLFYIIDIFIIFYSVYFIITGLFAFKKKKVIKNYKAKHKLAIVIAARNEAKVIGALISSLKKQNYPKNLYEIFVVPNNCTDKTEEIAKKAGATIINCTWPVKSKGDVLNNTFKYIKENHSEYEAYVIFDADNIVHSDFLSRMNDAISEGYEAAQGNRDSKNPSDSWISSSYSLIYLIQNIFFNRARANIGVSSFINGTGYMITKKVLSEYNLETQTMTEDLELVGKCALNDIKIGFLEDAITYDEQPVKFIESWKQRMRWGVGMVSCMKLYTGKLFKKAIKSRSLEAMDMTMLYISPVIQVATIFVFILFAIIQFYKIGIHRILWFITISESSQIISGYLITIIFSIVVLMFGKKSIKKYIKGIVTLFIFLATWVPINIICLFKKNQVWDQIVHDRVINIENINKK